MKYAGMAFQILAALGAAFFIGYKADQYFDSLPIFLILCPVIMLFYLFYKLIQETKSDQEK